VWLMVYVCKVSHGSLGWTNGVVDGVCVQSLALRSLGQLSVSSGRQCVRYCSGSRVVLG
jgi:hypothetical protein